MITSDKEARARARERDAQVGLPARRAAAELLSAVLQNKQPLDDILGRSLDKGAMFNLTARDRALTRAIVATSLRRKGQLDLVLGAFLERGLPERSGTLYPILLSAAAQLVFLKTPPHAAIDLAVTLAQYDPKAKRYDKLANAVLRKVASEGEAIAASLDAARVNTPDWLWSRWVSYWGETRAHAIAEAHLIEPPLDLSVKSEPELWAEQLAGRVLPTGSVRFLPKGRIEAAPRLSPKAPGGCRTWPRRCRPGSSATSPASAWPIFARRPAARPRNSCLPGPRWSRSTARRRGLRCLPRTSRGSGLRPNACWPMPPAGSRAKLFDAVLLDAPCSSTGTIRRHPDIPYTKSPKDIVALAGLQAKLLDNAAKLVKPGGKLVYSTCSLEPEEGEAQVAAFLVRNEAFRVDPIVPDELFGQEFVDRALRLLAHVSL